MTAALRFGSKKTKHQPPRVNLPILNSVDKAVIATDLSGTVVFWNRVAERTYGWTWPEVIGRPITELVVPDSAQPAAATIMKQLRAGKSWTGRFRLRRRDGTEFVGTVTDQPMHDDKGNLVGIIGVSEPDSEVVSTDEQNEPNR